MALLIHRRSSVPTGRRPHLVLLGGDGRWARPLMRLLEGLGFTASWLERSAGPSEISFAPHDILLVADATAAAWVKGALATTSAPNPVVWLTGSLHGLSTPVDTNVLRWPVTRESLEVLFEQLPEDPSRRAVL